MKLPHLTLSAAMSLTANVLYAQLQLSSADLAAIEATPATPADEMPPIGIFYSAANPNLAPAPGNIFQLPGWDLGSGYYLVDDLDSSGSGYHAMDDSGPAFPGGGYGGGSDVTNLFSYTPITNGLWLQVTNISDRYIYADLHGATDYVYEIYSTTNLAVASAAVSNWDIETEVFPGSETNTMPFNVPINDRNPLFLWARDWTGITSNGNRTPDWWFYLYFGTVDLIDDDLDSQGNTLLYDYTNIVDPNVINFTIAVTNQYISTNMVPVQLNVSGGIPFNIALVDSGSFTGAADNWHPYNSSNIVVDLAWAEGQHVLWVGLKGLPTNATVTWQEVTLTMLTNPPVIFVTNPICSTASEPLVQVQGFANESLSSLTFDVSNATGLLTGQNGYLTGQLYDTNALAFTAYYFQLYDVALANGLNIVTIHATDLAGNTETTNLNLTLEYLGVTNPPALSVIWPQNSSFISGSNFTLHARVDDLTAGVTATISDSNGDTNIVAGAVQRNGNVWAVGLPIVSGTNILTVTATNAAGLSVTTNLTLLQSPVIVTLDPLSGDQYNQTLVNVTGTISSTNEGLAVNGVQATINPTNGTWSATNVPASATGRAVFDLEAYIGDPKTNGSQQIAMLQPPAVIDLSYSDFTYDWDNSCSNDSVTLNWYWVNGVGGVIQDSTLSCGSDSTNFGTLGPDWGNGSPGSYFFRHRTETVPGYDAFLTETAIESLGVTTSGEGQPGTTQIYLLSVEGLDNSDGSNLPPQSMTFQGQPLQDSGVIDDYGGHWGFASLQRPAGTDLNSAISAPSTNYYYNEHAYQLVSQCVASTPADQARANVGVGEQVNIFFNPALPAGITNILWSTTGGGLLSTNESSTLFTAPSNAMNVTVTAEVQGVAMSLHFNVLAPTNIVMVVNGHAHQTNHANIGMHTLVYVQPDSVNFGNVWIQEEQADCVASGVYSSLNGIPHEAGPVPVRLSSIVVPGLGTSLAGGNPAIGDNIYSDDPDVFGTPPYPAGTELYAIPMDFQAGGTNATWTTNFDTEIQSVSLDTNQVLAVSKCGASWTCNVTNATVNYPYPGAPGF